MSRTIAALLIATFALSTTHATASADQQPAPAPGTATENLRAYVSRLPAGALVKVTPREGRSFKAILMVVEDDAIVVKPKTRIARPERRLPLGDVEFVELQEKGGGSVAKSVGIGVASGAGAFLALLLTIFAVYSD